MNVALESLFKLQTLEFGGGTGAAVEAEAKQLRELVPAPILAHYDRLKARGKKGVAVLTNSVCTACHMRQPVGKVSTLMRGEDIQLCDSCGRYLYLPPATAAVPAESAPPAPVKKARKPRKPKEPADG